MKSAFLSPRKIKKTFHLQLDQSDCGVACLRNILTYYRAELSTEKLREWSGTTSLGSSLLGLQQAAKRAGFEAAGMQADQLAQLREVNNPCILHFTIDDRLLHYVVYYPQKGDDARGSYLIGDPARGLIRMNAHDLEKFWSAKVLLVMNPSPQLSKWQNYRLKKIGWLWNVLQEDIHLLLIAMLLGVVCSVLGLSMAVFTQKLVDTILPGHQVGNMVAGIVILGFLLILRSFLSYIRQSLMIRQGFQFNTRLTGRFFQAVLYLNKFFFDNRKTGDLISRLNDTLRIQQATAYILGEMCIQLLMLVTALGLLFFYSWSIAVFCGAMVPALYGVVRYFERGIIHGQRETMIGHSRNESNYVDSIRGIHTIKVMNKEAFFSRLAKNIFHGFQQAVRKLAQVKARFNAFLEVTSSLFLLIIIAWSGWDVLHGSLQMGQMIAILQLAGLLMQSSVAVALTNLQVQEAGVAMDRMYEFTTLEPEYDIHSPSIVSINTKISFEKLSVEKMGFRFPGKKFLLKEINLEVNKGEIVALTGESGQGKSTLFQVLQKFYPYEAGHIWINGDKDLTRIKTPAWRNMIGVVPQDIILFSGNLLANICLDTATEHTGRLEEFCSRYGFDRYFESFPQSYLTPVGEGGIALSGGQKQLLALARCLYSEPGLLLLDEPTAAMDAHTEQFVIKLLQRIRKDRGILLISHKDSLTGIADRVYRLEGGMSFPLTSSKRVEFISS